MVPYVCLVSKICCAYLEVVLFRVSLTLTDNTFTTYTTTTAPQVRESTKCIHITHIRIFNVVTLLYFWFQTNRESSHHKIPNIRRNTEIQ
jgi:hypothetical protein